VSFSTWVNVAVWDIISLVSIGLLGSWYRIWATRSLRKAFSSGFFDPAVALVVVPLVVIEVPLVVDAPVVRPVMALVMMAPSGVRRAGRGRGCGRPRGVPRTRSARSAPT